MLAMLENDETKEKKKQFPSIKRLVIHFSESVSVLKTKVPVFTSTILLLSGKGFSNEKFKTV